MSEQTSTPKLTGQFSKALVYAELKHHNQVRKGGDIPYVGHLLTVAGLVINDGGSEAQAIAALLHDAVEDRRRSGDARGDPRRTSARTSRASSTSAATPTRNRSRRGASASRLHQSSCRGRRGHAAGLGRGQARQRDGRCCATTTSTGRRCGSDSPSRTRTTTSGTTASCLKPTAPRGCASWMVDELGRVVDELKRLVEGGDRIVLV